MLASCRLLGSEVEPLFLLKQFFLRFAQIGVVYAAVYGAYGGALRLFMETHAFRTLIGHDVIIFVGNWGLGSRGGYDSATVNFYLFQRSAIGPTPLSTTFINRIVGAFRFAGTAVDALVGYHYGHSRSRLELGTSN